jgi:membrane protein YqaA with SNARE-associated domain
MKLTYKENAKKLFLFLIITYAIIFSIKIIFFNDNFFSIVKGILKGSIEKFPNNPAYLYDYFIYMSMAFTFLPLPTIPTVILVGKTFLPFHVALIGALATTLANLNDYCIVSTLFLSKQIQKVHNSNFYQFLIKYFDKSPFIILTIGSFLPISIDIIRLLAISHQYPILKFSLANFLGRFPRYFLLAFFGYALQIPNIWILVILVLFLVISFSLKKLT